MKVFFTVTYQGLDHFGKYYRMIYEEITRLGYEHLDTESANMTYEEYVKKMEKGRTAQVENYHRNIEFIKKAEVVIIEVSTHSLGVGFLVQKALEMGKPTIVLYYKDNVPYFLQGIDDDKLIIKSYDEKNIKRVLKNAVSIAREKRDKRFNFFLSPKLLTYLEGVSERQGVTKSKILRDLIVAHMRENNQG
jgi:arginine utilization protein RocB